MLQQTRLFTSFHVPRSVGLYQRHWRCQLDSLSIVILPVLREQSAVTNTTPGFLPPASPTRCLLRASLAGCLRLALLSLCLLVEIKKGKLKMHSVPEEVQKLLADPVNQPAAFYAPGGVTLQPQLYMEGLWQACQVGCCWDTDMCMLLPAVHSRPTVASGVHAFCLHLCPFTSWFCCVASM